jgi:hypothetical protein
MNRIAQSPLSDELRSAVSLARENIYREGFTSVDDIVTTVRRWGAIVFPALIQGNTLELLNMEFDRIIALRHRLGVQVDETGNMVNVRLSRSQLGPDLFPTTAEMFGGSWMREITARYFAGQRFELNRDIFVTHLGATQEAIDKPPFALHFDQIQEFKFFIYLSDTDARNGATRIAPGSNQVLARRRKDDLAHMSVTSIPNIVPEPDCPSLSLDGPAGTLFIFDTNMAHGASHVEAGETRRTIRGHCWGEEMLRACGLLK